MVNKKLDFFTTINFTYVKDFHSVLYLYYGSLTENPNKLIELN